MRIERAKAMRKTLRAICACCCATTMLTGCGDVSGFLFIGGGGLIILVRITPPQAEISPGTCQDFKASQPVTWSLGAPIAGEPLMLKSPTDVSVQVCAAANAPIGVYQLSAITKAVDSKGLPTQVSIPIQVIQASTDISVAPAELTLLAGTTATFTAHLTNSTGSVRWSVSGGGTIKPTTPNGPITVYASPLTSGTVTVTATVSDGSKSATSAVTVTDGGKNRAFASSDKIFYLSPGGDPPRNILVYGKTGALVSEVPVGVGLYEASLDSKTGMFLAATGLGVTYFDANDGWQSLGYKPSDSVAGVAAGGGYYCAATYNNSRHGGGVTGSALAPGEVPLGESLRTAIGHMPWSVAMASTGCLVLDANASQISLLRMNDLNLVNSSSLVGLRSAEQQNYTGLQLAMATPMVAAVSSRDDKLVVFVDAATAQETKRIPLESKPLFITGDGTHLYAAVDAGRVVRFVRLDPATGGVTVLAATAPISATDLNGLAATGNGTLGACGKISGGDYGCSFVPAN